MCCRRLPHEAVLLSLLATMVLAPIVHAQEQAIEEDGQPGRAEGWRGFRMLRDIGRTVRDQVGSWEEQAVVAQNAAQRFWQQQGWTSEEDEFARELSVRVAAVPPWNLFGRVQTATDLIQQRYGLDDEQARELQRTVMRSTMPVLARHAPTILEYAKDAIAARATGQPPDPAQVAAWIGVMRPIRDEINDTLLQNVDEYVQTLRPEQQELARRDLAAFEARRQTAEKLLDRWEQGDWRPEDWGMTPEMFDPAWARAELQRNPETYAHLRESSMQDRPNRRNDDGDGGPLAARSPEQWQNLRRQWEQAPQWSNLTPEEQQERFRERFARRQDRARDVEGPAAVADAPDSWTAYVQAFIARYGLDPAQQATAWAIHKDVRARATEYMVNHRADLQALDRPAETPEAQAAIQQERATLLKPVTQLFEELKTRLEILPTAAQRLAAGEVPAAATRPASSTQPAATAQPAATQPAAAR